MLGRVIAHLAVVRFCRMLGTLARRRRPARGRAPVAREAIAIRPSRTPWTTPIDKVQRGATLSRSPRRLPQLFSASLSEMVAVAEESSRLDKELLRIAASYESQLDRELRMLVALVEPALLFLMAGVVGTIGRRHALAGVHAPGLDSLRGKNDEKDCASAVSGAGISR